MWFEMLLAFSMALIVELLSLAICQTESPDLTVTRVSALAVVALNPSPAAKIAVAPSVASNNFFHVS